jgi:hypothetical protein
MRTTTWGRTVAAVLLSASALWMPDVAGAQATDGDGPRVGCFRGRPLPACRSFWILEMQGSQPMLQSERTLGFSGGYALTQGAFDHVLEWNLGHMVNLGPELAVGGVITVGTGGDGPFTGLKVRGRRWLSPDVSVEVEGGIMRTDARQTLYPARTGVTADARLNIRDQGSFFVRWDGVDIPSSRAGDVYVDPGGFQHAFSVGVGVGSVPTLIGTGALGLGYLFLFAALIGSD